MVGEKLRADNFKVFLQNSDKICSLRSPWFQSQYAIFCVSDDAINASVTQKRKSWIRRKPELGPSPDSPTKVRRQTAIGGLKSSS